MLYTYDPRANRWLAPLVMPVGFSGQAAGVSGGHVVFLDLNGSLTLDLETKVFSPLSLPEEVRACWSGITPVFEAARVVLIAPAGCGGHEASVSALDPHHGTWKTAILPPVPRPHVPAAAQKSGFGGRLVWTGDQIIAWGDSFAIGQDTSCSGAPRNMPCDPTGPPMQQTSDGFILRPPL